MMAIRPASAKRSTLMMLIGRNATACRAHGPFKTGSRMRRGGGDKILLPEGSQTLNGYTMRHSGTGRSCGKQHVMGMRPLIISRRQLRSKESLAQCSGWQRFRHSPRQ